MHQKASGAIQQHVDYYFSWILQFIQPTPNASPKFAKQDPVPVLTHWSCNVFILLHALWPGVVQLAYSKFTKEDSLPFTGTVLLFITAHLIMTVRTATALLNLGAK